MGSRVTDLVEHIEQTDRMQNQSSSFRTIPLTFGTGFFRLGFLGYGAAPRFILTSSRTENLRGRRKSTQCPKTSTAAAPAVPAAATAITAEARDFVCSCSRNAIGEAIPAATA